LLVAAGALTVSYTKKLWLAFLHAVLLVVLMTFIRSWLRSGYLSDFFTLDQLKLLPQYSPFVMFLVTLVGGIVCVAWLLKKTADVFASDEN
jgi:hypothetical protein